MKAISKWRFKGLFFGFRYFGISGTLKTQTFKKLKIFLSIKSKTEQVILEKN